MLIIKISINFNKNDYNFNGKIVHKTRKMRQKLLFSFFNESEDHFNTTWRDIKNDNDLTDPLWYKYKLNAKKIGLMKSHLPLSHLPENQSKESLKIDHLADHLQAMHMADYEEVQASYQVVMEQLQPQFIDINLPEDLFEESIHEETKWNKDINEIINKELSCLVSTLKFIYRNMKKQYFQILKQDMNTH